MFFILIFLLQKKENEIFLIHTGRRPTQHPDLPVHPWWPPSPRSTPTPCSRGPSCPTPAPCSWGSSGPRTLGG